MKVTTSKSKNSESFYIAKSFINDKGVSTSVNIRKLGTREFDTSKRKKCLSALENSVVSLSNFSF